jgi:hypothetical protein
MPLCMFCWRRCWDGLGGSTATQAHCLWPQTHHRLLLLLLPPLLSVLHSQDPAPAALLPAAGGLSACPLLLCWQCALCLLPRAKPQWNALPPCMQV